jgi:hypothetical protein
MYLHLIVCDLFNNEMALYKSLHVMQGFEHVIITTRNNAYIKLNYFILKKYNYSSILLRGQ